MRRYEKSITKIIEYENVAAHRSASINIHVHSLQEQKIERNGSDLLQTRNIVCNNSLSVHINSIASKVF